MLLICSYYRRGGITGHMFHLIFTRIPCFYGMDPKEHRLTWEEASLPAFPTLQPSVPSKIVLSRSVILKEVWRENWEPATEDGNLQKSSFPSIGGVAVAASTEWYFRIQACKIYETVIIGSCLIVNSLENLFGKNNV